jgi:hypothetical protein
VANSPECGNETSDSIKCGEFLVQLRACEERSMCMELDVIVLYNEC